MIIVERIVTTQKGTAPSERDLVRLDWEARQKCRQRLRTKAGPRDWTCAADRHPLVARRRFVSGCGR